MRKWITGIMTALILASCSSGPAIGSSNTIEEPALTSLRQLISFYETGKVVEAEAMLSPSMIGRQEVSDAIRASSAELKEIRIALIAPRWSSVGDEVVAIDARWEKRFLSISPEIKSSSAKKISGKSLYFMHRMNDRWILTGQSGDDVFAAGLR